MTTDLVDRLASHRTLGGAPRDELVWLVSHGALRQVDTGETLSAKGQPLEYLHIVLSGHLAIFVDRGAGLHKSLEWRGGDVSGVLPYSRMLTPPGNSVALEPSAVFDVHRDHFPAMIRECPGVTSALVHVMIDRARAFTSSDLHDEKMLSLGKLSAGLAHELNNPASAIERSAALLDDRLAEAEAAARALGAARLGEAQLAAVEALRTSCVLTRVRGVRSPLEQAAREEGIADWLADRGLDEVLAEPLGETAVSVDALDATAKAIDGTVLNAALRWAAATCAVRTLAAEIQDAAERISGLVTAIKGFTHMDQAAVAEPVDLLAGLTNTVTVLRSKARSKAAAVVVDADADLPRVRGFAGELNQIFANLVDNALDAIPASGRVEVLARRERDRVVVRVVDNGPGIPPEIRGRIFDPFFTTKPVGQGTGLGLDIVRRLVVHNDGEIGLESQPGRTEFRVVLPTVEAGAADHRM
jgi:signal transduction histidine kinase